MRRAGSSAAAHLHRHRPERHPGPDMQRVLSVRERVAVDRALSFTRSALHEVRQHIERCGAQIDGPPFALRHAVGDDELDVEVGWPVLDGRGNGRVCAGLLPRGLLKPAGHAARH